MTRNCNPFGQPVGETMTDWTPRPTPGDVTLEGTFCRLEPLDVKRHADDLFAAYACAPDGRDWTYMSAGPFEDAAAYRHYAERIAHSTDPKHYAVIDTVSGKAVGTLSLMRIDPGNGVIEVGHVAFSPLLRQTPASTEAQFLLMRYVFNTLRYRRYEWKCDSLNAPSRNAAERLGFSFEGIFRQAVVYKDRTRDTAWFSIIDKEWPLIERAFQTWLSADNFTSQQQQKQRLTAIRSAIAQ